MTALYILFSVAGFAGIVFNRRIVSFDARRRTIEAPLVRTQILIASGVLLFMGFWLLCFKLGFLGA